MRTPLLAALLAGTASLSGPTFAGPVPAYLDHPAADEVFYHVMPIAWRDSNNDGGAAGNRFGDFGGLTASLDYLDDLGVTGVWINPIFPSPAYHGYQHGRADQLNPWFGTQTQFLAFVNAAHARGIKVYLDLVAYGISHDSPWYQGARNNPASIYDTWLAFTNLGNTQYQGYTFPTWNGANVGFIHWDLRTAAARDLVTSWAVKWLDPNGDGDPSDGVDGYRYDHVWTQYGNGPDGWGYNLDDFWTPFFAAQRAVSPDSFHFGEQADWGTSGGEFLSQFDAMFTKPFLFAARDAISNENASGLYSSMASTLNAANAAGRGTLLGSIGDHDVDRLASVISGSASLDKAKVAAAVQMLQPFPPNIYFGDEIGMRGFKGSYGSDADDIPRREPFKWAATNAASPMTNYWRLNAQAFNNRYSTDNDGRSVAEQQGVAGSLLETYRTLIALRADNIALRRGVYAPVTAANSGVWSFVRRYERPGQPTQSLVVAINLRGTNVTTNLNLGQFTIGAGPTTDLTTGAPATTLTTANRSAYAVTIPRYGYRVLVADATPPATPTGRTDGVAIQETVSPAILSVLQDTPTSAGDNLNELNALRAADTGDGLLVGIPGNIASDGTALALFIDHAPGGQATLDTSPLDPPPGGLRELTGTTFDAGFAPDTLLYVNAPGGTIYADRVALGAGPGVKTYLGSAAVNSGSGLLGGGSSGGVEVAYASTNAAGVTGVSAASAATATAGFEIFIPYAAIGLPDGACTTIGLAAAIVRTSGSVTNMWIPGLQGATSELGQAPNLSARAGTQHAFTLLPPRCRNCGTTDFDGDGDAGTDADIEAFFAVIGGGPCPTPSCATTDFDGDGDEGTDADIEAFFRVVGGGAC